jgi:hypothetical protein
MSEISTVIADPNDRAALALLGLQVRAARAETELAERQLAAAEDAARLELRGRLDALQEERRSMLLQTLDRARQEAAASIEAARVEAGLIDADTAASVVESFGADEPTIERTLLVHRSTSAVGQVSTSVTVDLDTLARVCAMVVTEVLEQRYGAGNVPATMVLPATVPHGYMPASYVPAPAQKQRGFFRNLMHADVLLILAAVAIVAVVLVAWMG